MPVDYDRIKNKLKKYKIPIISDSAEAFGAVYKIKRLVVNLSFIRLVFLQIKI